MRITQKERVWNFIRDNGETSTRQVREYLKSTMEAASCHMHRLRLEGHVVKVKDQHDGRGIVGVWKTCVAVYVPPKTGRTRIHAVKEINRKMSKSAKWRKSNHRTADELWATTSAQTELERVWGCFSPASVDVQINWRDMVR